MDRARIVTALALMLSMVSVVLGIANIGVASSDSPFTSSTESFLTAGRAGIALIEIEGAIVDGYYGNGADRIVEQLEQAENNAAVRAVLLSINSPGGAVGATKKIYERVMQLRLTKPVVAVVSDIAASGGYYIASACDRIFAYEGSLVGSIGVISIRPNVSDFLQRYGVQIETLKAGRYKDMSYPFRDLTDEERAMYDRFLNDAYQQFLEDVSKGRKKAKDDVLKWGEGRIYSGREARSQQIIDEIGGRGEAVAAIKIMLKTDQDLPLLRAPRSLLEELLSETGVRFASGAYGVLPGQSDELANSLLQSPVLYLYPGGPGFSLKLIRAVTGAPAAAGR
jgi:protease-4